MKQNKNNIVELEKIAIKETTLQNMYKGNICKILYGDHRDGAKEDCTVIVVIPLINKLM